MEGSWLGLSWGTCAMHLESSGILGTLLFTSRVMRPRVFKLFFPSAQLNEYWGVYFFLSVCHIWKDEVHLSSFQGGGDSKPQSQTLSPRLRESFGEILRIDLSCGGYHSALKIVSRTAFLEGLDPLLCSKEVECSRLSWGQRQINTPFLHHLWI